MDEINNLKLYPIKRALISVFDKEGIIPFAQKLHALGVEIISTGKTAKILEENHIPVIPIEKVTKNPEVFGGRIKTLSFSALGAILFRRNHSSDLEEAKKHHIEPIDLVVCNLYPFQEVFKKQQEEGTFDLSTLIENIDIGGPTMLRASAKNFDHVTVCPHPRYYQEIIHELSIHEGRTSYALRKKLMLETFSLTFQYDQFIAQVLSASSLDAPFFPFTFTSSQTETLRYGENPHQKAYLFHLNEFPKTNGLLNATCIQGKALSYNNYLDADGAFKSCRDAYLAAKVYRTEKNIFSVSIIKHANPSGLSVSKISLLNALKLSWEGDPVSAFGGILCFSSPIDQECALFLKDKFIEVILTPGITDEAKTILSKKKDLRIFLLPENIFNVDSVNPKEVQTKEWTYRSISGGGLLVQEEDEENFLQLGSVPKENEKFISVTKKQFPQEKIGPLKFGEVYCKHLKSNAISLVEEKENGEWWAVGAGMGQPNRIDSLKALAVPRAQQKRPQWENVILVSDAFFPFSDSIDVCAEMGIKTIVQPGGSIRDQEVIEAANRHGITMVFTGRRHFRH